MTTSEMYTHNTTIADFVFLVTLLPGALLGGVIGSYSHLGLDPFAVGCGGFVAGGAATYYLAKRWVKFLSTYVEVDVPVRELDVSLVKLERQIWRDRHDR